MAAPPDAYREAVERLYGLERGNRGPFGLEGTRALLDALDRPERAFASLHLAGTNGKGSTAALLERMVRATGVRTGLFTSPHLVDFRERIRIDGRVADGAALAARLDRIASLPASTGRTFFEATFALGALTFAEEKVDVAVLETGLGGRLDSTNVVTPALAVLTRIGLDHTELLGDTIEAVAGEKAGILKPGVTAVSATQDPRAYAVLGDRAAAVGARLVRAGRVARVVRVHALGLDGSDVTLRVPAWGEERVKIGLAGRHQIGNAVTALVAFLEWQGMKAGDRDVRAAALEGLEEVRWPGRFEAAPTEHRLVWDGAHNPDGARTLREAWRETTGDAPGVIVLGTSADKDARAMLDALAGPWREAFAVSARQPRAVPSAELAQTIAAAWPSVRVYDAGAVADGVRRALSALRAGERALVCGSLFVVGEAMAATGAGDLACL